MTKYIVGMTVTHQDHETDEYGMPLSPEPGLLVAMIRCVRAAKGCGLKEGKSVVDANPHLKDARGCKLLTFIVGEAGLGRLYMLSRTEGPVSYRITDVEEIGRYSSVITDDPL